MRMDLEGSPPPPRHTCLITHGKRWVGPSKRLCLEGWCNPSAVEQIACMGLRRTTWRILEARIMPSGLIARCELFGLYQWRLWLKYSRWNLGIRRMVMASG